MAQQIVYERPESHLGRGKYSTTPWVVGAITVLTLVFAAVFVFVVIKRRARRASDDVGPTSSRSSVRPGPPSSRPQAKP